MKGGGKRMTFKNSGEMKKATLKERLSLKNKRLTCFDCKNQTFLLIFGCIDFPFFDCVCSKCGSIMSYVGK